MLSRDIVEVVNFTTLGREAEVARRTLYLHWESIAHVIADAVLFDLEPLTEPHSDADLESRLTDYLLKFREYIDQPVVKNSYSLLLAEATRETVAVEAIDSLLAHHHQHFTALVTEVSRERYLEIISPIVLVGIATRKPMSDAALAALTAHSVAALGDVA
jgi:AcrR family transcriptional regulator